MSNEAHDPALSAARKPIGLALQGGGSWGAYTWGVLDAILASRSVVIAQLSGTSAGAINAAIVASALARGGAADARKALASFWHALASPFAAGLPREVIEPIGRKWRDSISAWLLSSGVISPYVANPLGINPLRETISQHVDIDAIRHRTAPALYVTVTNVRTGLPRVISNDEMTIDALLASACIPQVFHAVELDGEPYWDGGYSGNPTLWPMMTHGARARDLVLVQLAPEEALTLPKDAAGIRRRVSEIVFNSSLVAGMQAIAALRTIAARSPEASSVLDVRLHRVGPPPPELLELGSAFERSPKWLERLHEEGRGAGRRFLLRHGGDIGVRETLDIARVFSGSYKPKLRLSPGEASDLEPAAGTAM